MAEANGEPFAVPKNVSPRLADVLTSERDAYESRRRQFESARAVLASQAEQRALEVKSLEAKRVVLQNNLKLARERLSMSKRLLERELVARMEHLQLEAEVESLQGQITETETSIPKANVALAEAREVEREAQLKFRRAAAEELGQVELSIARTRELLAKATDQETRAVIRSPIEGVVKNLRFHTIGGVVRPGDPIMEIVPLNEQLVVEARLSPVDVGYVRTGQPAVVKVSTYDFVRYGALDGAVANVAADSSLDRNGQPYFKVVVQTDKAYLGDRPGEFPIAPGMQASVDIHTGSKPVLTYLITPVLKLRHEAFRER
jgi:adhesin transport system membrane fusion protein